MCRCQQWARSRVPLENQWCRRKPSEGRRRERERETRFPAHRLVKNASNRSSSGIVDRGIVSRDVCVWALARAQTWLRSRAENYYWQRSFRHWRGLQQRHSRSCAIESHYRLSDKIANFLSFVPCSILRLGVVHFTLISSFISSV